MKFIDHATLTIKAGNGGKGCIAFLREKHRPKGGPCGGDGGAGGNIIFRVNPHLVTLQDISLKNIYKAKNGAHGPKGGRRADYLRAWEKILRPASCYVPGVLQCEY